MLIMVFGAFMIGVFVCTPPSYAIKQILDFVL